MPLRLPVRPLHRKELDHCLEAGDRRWGRLLYRPVCAGCRACEPIRIEIASFRPSRSLRRCDRRGLEALEVELGPLVVDQERIELFEKHRRERALSQEPELSEGQYHQFLVDRCCEAFEIRYRLDGRLVAVAITDRGERALNAVYTYFDPSQSTLSLGTFSILTQVRLARGWKMSYLYLGLYIADHRHMKYKARFRPHQRRIGGRWRTYGADGR